MAMIIARVDLKMATCLRVRGTVLFLGLPSWRRKCWVLVLKSLNRLSSRSGDSRPLALSLLKQHCVQHSAQ